MDQKIRHGMRWAGFHVNVGYYSFILQAKFNVHRGGLQKIKTQSFVLILIFQMYLSNLCIYTCSKDWGWWDFF